MSTVGLVLEGGGMRGVYTAGVLEYFAQQNLYFPYNIGVSAGACNAASYLSRQHGRNRIVNIGLIGDPRYLSWRNLWKNRELFGMDFIFNEIPNSLVPFDYASFYAAREQFIVGTTDCESGQPVYFSKDDADADMLTVLRASSSLPLIAPVVECKGKKLLDGGISDPVPIRKAERDGCTKTVVVLTRNKGYVKKPSKFPSLLRRAYRSYPHLVETIVKRHEVYNETMAHVEQQNRNNAAFIIRPQLPLVVGRIERNQGKLQALYDQGFEDAKRVYPALMEWMQD